MALKKPAFMSSSDKLLILTQHPAKDGVDGKTNSVAASAEKLPAWFYVDLEAIVCVHHISILNRPNEVIPLLPIGKKYGEFK